VTGSRREIDREKETSKRGERGTVTVDSVKGWTSLASLGKRYESKLNERERERERETHSGEHIAGCKRECVCANK